MRMDNVIVALLTAALLVAPVMAAEFPVEAAPGNFKPYVYLLEWGVDIGIDEWVGGSTPEESNNPFNMRSGMYAFTGEQMGWLIAVRDLNGAADIDHVYLTIDGLIEVLCVDISGEFVKGDYSDEILPLGPSDPAGFDPDFDKIFYCIVTVEPDWYGPSMVNIEAYDQTDASTNSIAQEWYFNPAIILDLSTNDGAPSIEFEDGVPGQTVYSKNKLIITNYAEGGVDLYAWISMDDLVDPTNSGALCPYSNVLDVDAMATGLGPWGVEYRGNKGSYFGEWTPITNPDPTDDCEWALTGDPDCEGAQGIVQPDWSINNIIRNMQSAEVQFRLTYPVPCIGDFTQGMIHVVVRAV